MDESHQPWHSCLIRWRSSMVRSSIAWRTSFEESVELNSRVCWLGLTSRRSLIYLIISICSFMAAKLIFMHTDSRIPGLVCWILLPICSIWIGAINWSKSSFLLLTWDSSVFYSPSCWPLFARYSLNWRFLASMSEKAFSHELFRSSRWLLSIKSSYLRFCYKSNVFSPNTGLCTSSQALFYWDSPPLFISPIVTNILPAASSNFFLPSLFILNVFNWPFAS